MIELDAEDASNLEDGDVAVLGHDGRRLDYTTNERPNEDTRADDGANVQKVKREWKVDLTGSSSQTVSVDVDLSSLFFPSGYNDFDNLRWLGGERGDTPLFGGPHLGEWHCVEAHVRLNDAGRTNGLFELWIDGELDARADGLNWVGSYDEYGLNAVFLENYWNAGSPVAQERYFDQLVVSTERIGC